MSAAEMLAGAAPGPTPDWYSIPWKKVRRPVRRLQARIVKAVMKILPCRQFRPSEVGTVPGGMVGLAMDPGADRWQSDVGRFPGTTDRQERPRPARGVSECLSRMRGNSHVRF